MSGPVLTDYLSTRWYRAPGKSMLNLVASYLSLPPIRNQYHPQQQTSYRNSSFHILFLEIIFGSKSYTKGVDIWAVGTIVGEMINGRPVFPGVTTMNQIERQVF